MLIVDDDAAIGHVLEDALRPWFDAHAVTSPKTALQLVKDQDIAIILADQRMPAMSGLQLLSEVRRIKPTAVGVLMTAYAELEDALRAINSVRVVGFVAKPWDHDELMGVMQRALEAHVALRNMSRGAHSEIALLQSLANSAPTPVTAQGFGVLPLRDSLPDQFARMVRRYRQILGDALEQRGFKVERQTGQSLRELAHELGTLSAGPRDVIDLHVTALGARVADASSEESGALVEEGRLLVLELMGHLVTYYRSYTLGVRA